MTWTKLAYGTLAAGALLGGLSIYHGAVRSTVSAVDVADLVEAVNERSAAVASWPWTTNAQYAGWGYGYRTNIEDSALWSFMGYRVQQYPLVCYIPLIAGAVPGHAINESLRQAKALAPQFVRDMSLDSYGWPVPRYHSVTSLWHELQIGDGTSKWTIAYGTNGLPVYGDEVAGSVCTTTVFECWKVLNVFTQTWRTASRLNQTNEIIEEPFGFENVTLPAGDPPGDPNGEPIVQQWNQYALSANWQTNSFTSYSHPFETWDSRSLYYSVYSRWMEADGTLISKTNYLTTGWYSWTPRIQGVRSFSTYGLAFPTFPSGVCASASFFARVDGTWSIKGIGVDTNLTILGVSTTVLDVAFSTPIATNIFTNLNVVVVPSATNWIPSAFQSVETAMIFDGYRAWTNAWGQYEQAWRWKGRESYSSPFFSFGGTLSAYEAGVLITWTFKQR